ncbi:MAG: hypothetical protein AAF493_10495, partial [Pseudomonadota bacterium]
MQKQRVAVLVHNSVVKDARVRKQVSTLSNRGLSVDVFGVSLEPTDRKSSIEGSDDFQLVDLSRTDNRYGLLYAGFRIA